MNFERRVGDRTLRIECAEAHERRVASVLDVFERLATSGTKLRAGMRVRFGWSLFALVDEGEGLRVTEPDFARWPSDRWSPTLDISLDVLAAQTSLLHRLGVEGQDVAFDESIVAAKGAIARPGVFLRRVERLSDDDSGWLLGPLDDPEALEREDELEGVLIASLVTTRRSLLQVLVLPTGFIVVFEGDTIAQIFDAEGRER